MEDSEMDLSKILEAWSYGDKKHVRRVTNHRGDEVLQVRLPLGIEQYEFQGRPDGRRPQGQESWFHYYVNETEKKPWDIELSEEDFQRLKEECLLYYYRYLLFFQVGEYEYCSRDTMRNIEVLDFTDKYFSAELCASLQQYRPYILRMHFMSEALGTIDSGGDIPAALAILAEASCLIDDLPKMAKNKIFPLEQKNSLRAIEELRQQLFRMLPPDPLAELREKLAEAIATEDYEEAARLRDSLQKREDRSEPS